MMKSLPAPATAPHPHNMRVAFFHHTLVASILLLQVLLNACTKTDDTTRIYALVDSATEAARNRNPGVFEDILADEFQSEGVGGKREMLGLLRLYWLRYQQLYVVVTDRKLIINGDVATLELIVLVAGAKSAETIMPEQGDHMNISATLKKTGDWQVTSVSWQ